MKIPNQLKLAGLSKASVLMLALLAASINPVHAADIRWTGGTASYTNAASWDSNSVPTATDNAFNNNGPGAIVQINNGDPNWAVNDLKAGGDANTTGAFVQNGQTLTVNSWLILGDGANSLGTYTFNAGTLNVGTLMFSATLAGIYSDTLLGNATAQRK